MVESGLTVIFPTAWSGSQTDPVVLIVNGYDVCSVITTFGAPIISTNLPPFCVSVRFIVSPSSPSTSVNVRSTSKSNPFDVKVSTPPPTSTAVIPSAALFIFSTRSSITSAKLSTSPSAPAINRLLSSPVSTE